MAYDVITEAAKRDIHNLPTFNSMGVTIDLVEYEEMDHVGIRVYENQMGLLTKEGVVEVYKRMLTIQSLLENHKISASLEKIQGSPPARER